MTATGKRIVDDFPNLLRISREIDYPAVSDEELVASADSLFLESDRREKS